MSFKIKLIDVKEKYYRLKANFSGAVLTTFEQRFPEYSEHIEQIKKELNETLVFYEKLIENHRTNKKRKHLKHITESFNLIFKAKKTPEDITSNDIAEVEKAYKNSLCGYTYSDYVKKFEKRYNKNIFLLKIKGHSSYVDRVSGLSYSEKEYYLVDISSNRKHLSIKNLETFLRLNERYLKTITDNTSWETVIANMKKEDEK